MTQHRYSLSDADHLALKHSIQSLERTVKGELVIVLSPASDTYRFIPTLWAALIALSVPGLFLVWLWLVSSSWSDPASIDTGLIRVYTVQVMIFFGLLLLFQREPVQRLIVPNVVMKQRASRLAREQFLTQRLHHTKDRFGVLIFISHFERHVEILVDKGLSESVDDSYWESTIKTMQPALKRGDTRGACASAIEAVATVLIQYASNDDTSVDVNELPDHVVEL